MEQILVMKGIHKKFPGVYALKGIDLNLNSGEILGLMGENGAGKSTLMKILGGVHNPTSGKILIGKNEYGNLNPEMAKEAGIGFVHQELNLAESITVAENIFIGRLPLKNSVFKTVDSKKLYEDTKKILEKLGCDISPNELVKNLTTGKKQMVEIAKAVSMNCKILILDEPSTSLSDEDVKKLFEVMKTLKKEGVGQIYISHRFKEIFEICDRATILRDGTYVGTVNMKETSKEQMIKMMVGREISNLFPKENTQIGEVVLQGENISDYKGKVKNVDFHLKKSEILGFAGLVGAGRTELMRLIFGADSMSQGKIILKNENINISSPEEAIKNGICLLTEDRKKQGLLLNLSVEENINITKMEKFLIQKKNTSDTAEKFKKDLFIKTYSIKEAVKNLSGGNQQKVVLAKWLNTNSDIFIFDEPTKGIDIGAKTEIYNIMNKLVKEGKSVIMISSELPELMAMSDRVYVMCEGRITGCLEKKDINQEKIMKLATRRVG
ncbi:MAG: sugar ABC transporter ATP-binding protein [Fusobacteriaceae bacterium]